MIGQPTVMMHSLGQIDEFIDHFKIIERIKPYYPDIRLNSRKRHTFDDEHSLYSKYEREIKKGYSLELVFENDVIREIEKPMEVFDFEEKIPVMYFENVHNRIAWEKQIANMPQQVIKRVFLPKVLKSSQDYDEEGHYMTHCVAGYIGGTDYSIIISLRLGEERVTSEFTVTDRRCIQSRYFKNADPPEYFRRALKILSERIKSVRYPIKPIKINKVQLIINGIPVKLGEERVTKEWVEPAF